MFSFVLFLCAFFLWFVVFECVYFIKSRASAVDCRGSLLLFIYFIRALSLGGPFVCVFVRLFPIFRIFDVRSLYKSYLS